MSVLQDSCKVNVFLTRFLQGLYFYNSREGPSFHISTTSKTNLVAKEIRHLRLCRILMDILSLLLVPETTRSVKIS